MLIHTSLPMAFKSPLQDAKSSIAAQRQELEDSIDDQRMDVEEAIFEHDLSYEEWRAKEKFLDSKDPRVAESRARNWRSAAFAIVGGTMGALAGAQGGWTGALFSGLAVGGASTVGIHKSADEGVLSAVGSGAFFGGVVGLLGATGGTFGAIVGGVAGAAVAASLPGLVKGDR